MSEAVTGINFAISVAGLAVCAIGLLLAINDRMLEKTTKGYLVALFSTLIVYVSFNLASQCAAFFSSAWAAGAQRLFIFCESTFSSLAMLVLVAFLLHSCGERRPTKSFAFRVAMMLWLTYFCMLASTWFSGVIYTVDEKNVYSRGPLYPALLVPTVLIMVLSLVVLWRRRAALTARQRMAFVVYVAAPGAAMVFQMLFYGLYTIVAASAIGAFVLLACMQADAAEHYYQTEVENARLKSEIMLSQLQPHFLCNTLGAIGHLCGDNPQAREAIHTFSRYLRENVDALAQTVPVPFERELEHARTYLELERLRFGDDLHVAFDIGCTEFLVPTLTLQPLTENAVRHGIRGTEEGAGTVTISSRELADRWEVCIADDGAGFDPHAMPNDGRTHVGLANVRERLRIVCNGDLRIESSLGAGCKVTIMVPKE